MSRQPTPIHHLALPLLQDDLPRGYARPMGNTINDPAQAFPFNGKDLARQRCVNHLWAAIEHWVYGP
ncbi:hypothetical protein KQ304_07670 [Synechococcus sp. CS-1329]|uniref:hypothetical protein n=1 Tax=Synechococcus sp. CS-1329 TaxID=2847975 RepID=UPI00223B64C6|nr:hypothetical protein [Synechococcus sp. CS-1329]MCT0218876.1 hypothetical protein [Synechococcus sp. CS-1329]